MKGLCITIGVAMLCCRAASAQTPEPEWDGSALSQSQVEDLQSGHALGAAELASARPVGAVTMALIMSFEGWSEVAYDDPSHYCTIGYGHLIALKPCTDVDLAKAGFNGKITKETGLSILFQDTSSARIAVQELVSDSYKLGPDQFGALVSFTFNVGKANFRASKLLNIVNARAYDQVPPELMKWIKSKGKKLDGLVRRRACEGGHFEGVLDLNAQGSVDCPMPSLGIASEVDAIDISTGQ